MTDDRPTHQDRIHRNAPPSGLSAYLQTKDGEGDGAEASCGAFGYLRGIRDTATSLELRFKTGNSMFFPYGLMGAWKYNPSEGLLLKFSGDLIYLVLIRGSNLATPLMEGSMDLIHGGLQRHKVLWMREMSEEEIRQVGENGPTIDSIEVSEFGTHEALTEWLKQKAPAFLR
jgi:hypothetical protein